jgi:hypothetical protein
MIIVVVAIVIFASLLYIVLIVSGISKETSFLIAFLTLVGGLVAVSLIYFLSLRLRQPYRKLSKTASRRDFFRRAGTMSAVIALQPLLTETDASLIPSVSSEPLSPIISEPLQRLADALTQAKQWQEAERVARSIEIDGKRVDALVVLAAALTQAGESTQARIIWQEVERIARSIENNGLRWSALGRLAAFLTQAKQWQEAERVARTLEDDYWRNDALKKLAGALAQAKQWQEAERVILSIPNSTTSQKEKPSNIPSQSPNQATSRLPLKKPDSSSPGLDELIKAFISSPEGDITAFLSMIASITGVTAIGVIKWLWSKKHSAKEELPTQSLETDFDRIRLRMAHGTDHILAEWLDDPDKLKRYIDACNQPSSSNPVLKVYFRQRNGTEIPVDAENYLHLDEVLSYLKSQIERKKPKLAEN